jgi:putative transposase
VRYATIDQLRNEHPVSRLCALLDVAKSGYQAWSAGKVSPRRKLEDMRLLVAIRAAHQRGRGTYGPKKILDELADQGIVAGLNRIRRLRTLHGIRCTHKKKFRVTTDSKHNLPVAPNLLDRQFVRSAPNQVWVADITYIPTDEGWLFLAAIKDLHTCEIVGWAMDSRMTKTLVADALRAAYWRKKPKPGLMHQSDCGSQCCSSAYRALQASYGIKTSMSRKGNCWDNAPMESFFGALKTESLHHYRFATREQARQVIFEYIEVFYNRIRRHAKIGNQIPADFANQFYPGRKQSAA